MAGQRTLNPRIMVRIHAPEPIGARAEPRLRRGRAGQLLDRDDGGRPVSGPDESNTEDESTARWPRLRRFLKALSAPPPSAQSFAPFARAARTYPFEYMDSKLPYPLRVACLASPGHVLSVPFLPWPVSQPLENVPEDSELLRVYRLWGGDVDGGPTTTAPFSRFVGTAGSDHRRSCPWFQGAVGPTLAFELSWLLPTLALAGGDRVVVDRFARYISLLRVTEEGVRAGIAIPLEGDRSVSDARSPRALESLNRFSVSVEESVAGQPPDLVPHLGARGR